MLWTNIQQILTTIQHIISIAGILIIISGLLIALYQYLAYSFSTKLKTENFTVNTIRLNLGRILILGLEFIVAADLIGSTTAPDYYTVGLLAIIVLIRTLLSYSLNREIASLSKEPN